MNPARAILMLLCLAAGCTHSLRREEAPSDDEVVFPTPRLVVYGGRDLILTDGGSGEIRAVLLVGEAPSAAVMFGVEMLNDEADALARRRFPVARSLRACADYPTVVSIGTPESNALNRDLLARLALNDRLREMGEEGYLIREMADGEQVVILIAGNTARGTMYGVMTFLQMMKAREGNLAVRPAAIDDYPAFKTRIFADGAKDTASLKTLIRYKINVAGIHYPRDKNWRAPDEGYRKLVKDICAFARASDAIDIIQYINCYHGAFSLDEGRAKGVFIDLLDEGEIERLTETFRIALREGARSVMICVDDFCWWDYLTERERERFGDIAEAQAWLVNEVYGRLRKEFPSCRILFCPVGPTDGYAGNPTPTNAQGVMLRKVRERIPADVPIVWTGPVVRSRVISRWELENWAAVVGRKPFLWDNTIYSYDEYYTTQNLWNGYRTEGFPRNLYRYLDGEGIHVNTGVTERSMVGVMTVADYLWNPQSYDPVRSMGRAMNLLYGRELSDVLNAFKRRYIDLFAIRFHVEDRHYPADRAAWDRFREEFHKVFRSIERTCGNRALVEELRVVVGEFDECHRRTFERADRIFSEVTAAWGQEAMDRLPPGSPARVRGIDVASLDGLKERLIAGGRAQEDVERILGESRREKVVVVRLLEGSNAGRAGLEVGDDIVEYDRRPIKDIEHLSFYIQESVSRTYTFRWKPRREVWIPIVVRRGGVEHRLEVAPGPLGVVIRTRRSIPVVR